MLSRHFAILMTVVVAWSSLREDKPQTVVDIHAIAVSIAKAYSQRPLFSS